MHSPFSGFIYPNEYEMQWGLLIVIYPYLTGLVAGAFILASLNRTFNVKVLEPVYRLALLTALAFLIVAPLPLFLSFGAPGTRLRDALDAPDRIGHGDVRLCLCLVFAGCFAVGNLV